MCVRAVDPNPEGVARSSGAYRAFKHAPHSSPFPRRRLSSSPWPPSCPGSGFGVGGFNVSVRAEAKLSRGRRGDRGPTAARTCLMMSSRETSILVGPSTAPMVKPPRESPLKAIARAGRRAWRVTSDARVPIRRRDIGSHGYGAREISMFEFVSGRSSGAVLHVASTGGLTGSPDPFSIVRRLVYLFISPLARDARESPRRTPRSSPPVCTPRTSRRRLGNPPCRRRRRRRGAPPPPSPPSPGADSTPPT